jgi:hypothetical protein
MRTRTTARLSSMSLNAGMPPLPPLELQLEPEGHYTKIDVVSSSLGNPMLNSCLYPKVYSLCRDSLGDSVVAGDLRWAGAFGVNVDFVARSHCSVVTIDVEEIRVRTS